MSKPTIEDRVISVLDFIENGCSARPEDKCDATATVRALEDHINRIEARLGELEEFRHLAIDEAMTAKKPADEEAKVRELIDGLSPAYNWDTLRYALEAALDKAPHREVDCKQGLCGACDQIAAIRGALEGEG